MGPFRNVWAEAAIQPWAVVLQVTPVVAIAPLLVIMLLVGALVLLQGTAVAPFIYTLF